MLPAFETGRLPPVNFVNQLAVSSGLSVILSLLQEPGALLCRKGTQLTWRLTAHSSLVEASTLSYKALDLSLPYMTRMHCYLFIVAYIFMAVNRLAFYSLVRALS